MTLKPFLRPKSIIDPELTKETIEQCEINASKFLSDDHLHKFILSEINDKYEIDTSSIQNYRIIRPNTVQFQIVLLKMKDNFTKDQEFFKSHDGSALGRTICIHILFWKCLINLAGSAKRGVQRYDKFRFISAIKRRKI
jgi:hypothetical protein